MRRRETHTGRHLARHGMSVALCLLCAAALVLAAITAILRSEP